MAEEVVTDTAEVEVSGCESPIALFGDNVPEAVLALVPTSDPFADVGRGTGRGPGWQRAAGTLNAAKPGGEWQSRTFTREPARVVESRASAVSLGNKGRSDLSVGMRVFHQKFGYGEIAEIEGNKLEIDFEQAGRKRVMDSFVTVG